MKKFAFTLAEVLITLGIIGVVSALTLSTLIKNIQAVVLENQFKTSISTVNQVLMSARNELGINKIEPYCRAYNGKYYNSAECINAFNNTLVKKSKNKNPYQYLDITRNEEIRTYNNKEIFYNTGCSKVNEATILSNGTYASFRINCESVIVSVDINGAKKPNRVGHDIFVFRLNSKDFLSGYGTLCDVNSTDTQNGLGCGGYALQDICPKTGKTGYFKCLPR